MAIITVSDIDALINTASPSPNDIYYLMENNKQGEWRYIPYDTTPQNVGTVLNASGGRFKRIIASDFINAKWFGAIGDYNLNPLSGIFSTLTDAQLFYPHATSLDQSIDWAALQLALNTVIKDVDLPRKIYIPRGRYVLSNPLLAMNWTGSDYEFLDFQLEGYTSQKSGIQTPEVTFVGTEDMNNLFFIGIQRCRNVHIKNIWFRGNYTKSEDTFTLDSNFYRRTRSGWEQTGISNSRFSPHCAIHFDPFGPDVPGDGGYPGFSSYYRGGYDGSSCSTVEGCRFWGFSVGTAISLNGKTLNAEIIHIIGCAYGHCITCHAVGQDQTIQNEFRDIMVWEYAHTVIDCLNYGVGVGSPPLAKSLNIAGNVYQLINCEGGRLPFHGFQIYAENMFKIGVVKPLYFIGNAASTFIDCRFDFIAPDYFAPSPDFIVLGRVNFINCNIRMQQNDPSPWRLKFNNQGNAITFQGGTTPAPIVSLPIKDNSKSAPYFENVITHGYTQQFSYNRPLDNLYPNSVAGTLVGKTTICYKDDETLVEYKFEWNETCPDECVFLENAIVTVSENNATVAISAGSLKKVRIGDYLVTDKTAGYSLIANPDYITDPFASGLTAADYIDICPVLGYVYAINDSTGEIILKGCSINIPEGNTSSIPIYVNYLRFMNNPLIGNVTIGNPTITEVEYYQNPILGIYLPVVGDRLEIPFFPKGCYITDVNPVAKTITLSENSTHSKNDVTVINGKPRITAEAICTPDQYIKFVPATSNFFEGTFWKARLSPGSYDKEDYTEYVIDKSTFLGEAGTHPFKYRILTSNIEQISINDLKFKYYPNPDILYFINDTGREGFFKLDPTETYMVRVRRPVFFQRRRCKWQN